MLGARPDVEATVTSHYGWSIDGGQEEGWERRGVPGKELWFERWIAPGSCNLGIKLGLRYFV